MKGKILRIGAFVQGSQGSQLQPCSTCCPATPPIPLMLCDSLVPPHPQAACSGTLGGGEEPGAQKRKTGTGIQVSMTCYV